MDRWTIALVLTLVDVGRAFAQPICEGPSDDVIDRNGVHIAEGPDVIVAQDGAVWRGHLLRDDTARVRIRRPSGAVCELPSSRVRWAGPLERMPAFRRVRVRTTGASDVTLYASGVAVCGAPCDAWFLMAGRRLTLGVVPRVYDRDSPPPAAAIGTFEVGGGLDLHLEHASHEAERMFGRIVSGVGGAALVLGVFSMAMGVFQPLLPLDVGGPIAAAGLGVMLAGLPLFAWGDGYVAHAR